MKVQFYTFSQPGFDYVQKSNSNYGFRTSNLMGQDTFVKKAEDVSFKGNDDDNNDILDALLLLGITGAPFVFAIAMGSYMGKHGNVKDIFTSDGTYVMSLDDESVKSDKVIADADDGILKIKDTPINIDASKYDYADVQNGVFKNYDGSVDIDLANNKYIDLNNGIFIDPVNKISAINIDGTMENIVIPDFVSTNFKGASMSNHNYSKPAPTRTGYFAEHGHAPEDSNYGKTLDALHYPGRIAYPDDNRTVLQRILDFFDPFSSRSSSSIKFDQSKQYDVFGREILDVEKPDGSFMKIALDEKLQYVVDKYHLNSDSIGELSEFFDKIKLDKYLLEYKPNIDFSYFHDNVHESFQDFITRLTENHADVAQNIAMDTINETIANAPNDGSFLDVLHSIFDSIGA